MAAIARKYIRRAWNRRADASSITLCNSVRLWRFRLVFQRHTIEALASPALDHHLVTMESSGTPHEE